MFETIEERDARDYLRAFTILQKLTPKNFERGLRTFEEMGVVEGVAYDACFTAMMYGERQEYSRSGEDFMSLECPLLRERVPELTDEELLELSHIHFMQPHIVFLAACDLMDC